MTARYYIPTRRARNGMSDPNERERVEGRIRAALDRGDSDREAAVYAGVTDRTVNRYRDRHGIKPNDPRGRRKVTHG